MKPLMFKIIEKEEPIIYYKIILFYEDGTTQEITIVDKPKGLELNKPYSIADIYDYVVIDNMKGL